MTRGVAGADRPDVILSCHRALACYRVPTVNMEWPNELIFEFLSLYEKEPTLWNKKTAEHKNRRDLSDAWSRIKNQFKDGKIPIVEIKKKRGSLMSTYRKLRSKIEESIKTGSGANEIYKPDWPFYDVMSKFLDNVYNPRKTRNSDDSEDKQETEDENDIYNIQNDEKRKNHEETWKKTFKTPKNRTFKRLKKNGKDKRMDEVYNYFKQMAEKDKCSLYTDLLCKKLRGLQEKTREIAMLEIDRLIFQLKQSETPTQFSHSQPQFYHTFPFQNMQNHSQQSPSFHLYPQHPSQSIHPSSTLQSLPSTQQSPSAQPSPSFHPSPTPQSLPSTQ